MYFQKIFSFSLLVLLEVILYRANFVVCDPVVVAVPEAQEPAEIARIPLYDALYNRPEEYHRIHLLVIGVVKNSSAPLGLLWWVRDPQTFLEVETYGEDTGSTDYFPIGYYKSDQVGASTKEENYLFEFDIKKIFLYKVNGTSGVRFSLKEANLVSCHDMLFQFNLSIDEFPKIGDGYVEYRRLSEVPSHYYEMENAEFIFKIKIEEATNRIVEKQELLDVTYNISNSKYARSGVEYDETVLYLNKTGSLHEFQQGLDKALVQSWRHVDGTKLEGAILWVIGRTDCFMHSHVVERLFFGPDSYFKFDVYVLNWRLNGLAAVHRGWLTDAWYWSHLAYADYDIYNEEINATLDLMKPAHGGVYDKVLGYGHSTGGTILLNYIVDYGDSSFDGFLFNSPFLDFADSCLKELFAKNGVKPIVDAGGKGTLVYLDTRQILIFAILTHNTCCSLVHATIQSSSSVG